MEVFKESAKRWWGCRRDDPFSFVVFWLAVGDRGAFGGSRGPYASGELRPCEAVPVEVLLRFPGVFLFGEALSSEREREAEGVEG